MSWFASGKGLVVLLFDLAPQCSGRSTNLNAARTIPEVLHFNEIFHFLEFFYNLSRVGYISSAPITAQGEQLTERES